MNFEPICRQFFPGCKVNSAEEIKVGHINQTYRLGLTLADGSAFDGLLQAVNTYVFKQPELVMENIARVTEYMRQKVPNGCNLTYYNSTTGKNYYRDHKRFWRLINYIPSSTYNSGEDLAVVAQAAQAFGRFQEILSDFPAESLHETIPGFHNTIWRFENLWKAADTDPQGRRAEVQEELAYLRTIETEACTLTHLLQEGKLPLRVTHNDTKINNVLFDTESREALVVIDLDTVMPGLVGHDFGDAIRTAANTEAEDSLHYDKASLDLPVFRTFAENYLRLVGDKLTETEVETLALSSFCMTIESAVRFLTDYLEGDVYFRTAYPEHNRIRTRCQLVFAKDIQAKMPQMQKMIREIMAQ